MLYNAFAGDYNRLRGESADPAFSPALFFPLWPGDAIMAQPSYLSREGLENLKNELAFTEGRILTLDNMINNAVIIEETQGGRATLEVGTTIAVMDQDGRSFRYTIVGSAEADPSRGTISNVSLIGQSLLGKRVGDVAKVNAPSGEIRLEVLAIE